MTDEPRTTNHDARALATRFILSLPKFEGMQQISEAEPEKFKVYRDLIDKLEKLFEDVALEAQRYTERTGKTFNRMPTVREEVGFQISHGNIYFKDMKIKKYIGPPPDVPLPGFLFEPAKPWRRHGDDQADAARYAFEAYMKAYPPSFFRRAWNSLRRFFQRIKNYFRKG